MKIAMANDHAGTSMKNEIKAYLEEQGHEVVDFGTYDEESCDLSDFVLPAALAVAKGECDRGIFVDGVGYGSAMIAMEIVKTYMSTDALTADKYVRRVKKVQKINDDHCVPVR